MSHEGSFLEATDAQFEAAVPTELAASMDASAGARLLHKLALSRSAVAALRDTTTRVKRIFWLANHTTGCNWSTVAQLKFREEHDANAVVRGPHFTPLAIAFLLSIRRLLICRLHIAICGPNRL